MVPYFLTLEMLLWCFNRYVIRPFLILDKNNLSGALPSELGLLADMKVFSICKSSQTRTLILLRLIKKTLTVFHFYLLLQHVRIPRSME